SLWQGFTLVLRLENAVPVSVQRQRPSVSPQPAAQQVHMRLDRAPRIETRQLPIGGIINHADEHHARAAALQPVMLGSIHLHQLAKTGTTRSTTAVRIAATAALPQTRGQQPAPQRFWAD